MITNFFSYVFISNIVLMMFLGLECVLKHTERDKSAFDIIVSAVAVMTVSSATNYWLYFDILKPLHLEVLTLLVFSINIVLVSIVTSWFLKNFFNILYEEIRETIPIAALSTLILGVSLLNIHKNIDVYGYIYVNLCSILGFVLVIILLKTIRDRLTIARLPKNVEGLPILLIVLGLISMAFMGFVGVN